MQPQSVARALAHELSKTRHGVFLRYDLAHVAWRLYKAGSHDGVALNIRRQTLDARTWSRLENALVASGVLRAVPDVPDHGAFALIGSSLTDRNALICSLDPFCYLSHLSAMEFHGLTDRMPEQLYVCTPADAEWTMFAQERMSRDLGEDLAAYRQAGLPQLRRVAVTRLNQRPVHRFRSSHRGAFRVIKDSPVRVATLGRTFLDMLREPDLCGGLLHVIECFEQHASTHRRLIFDELDQHGRSIDKVRAGFILEAICHVTDPRIDAWLSSAVRGGSRKLDSAAEYAPVFSERWALSINVPRWQGLVT